MPTTCNPPQTISSQTLTHEFLFCCSIFQNLTHSPLQCVNKPNIPSSNHDSYTLVLTMSLPVACPAPTTAADPPTVPQRKRRRRAPASGASDDCFTCLKRNAKCDRRRPYCSQCLEVGNECSGYKTQLTWGVGVASRGKLRGLSLPVARSAPAPKSPTRTRTRALSSVSGHHDILENVVRIKSEQPTSSSLPNNAFTTYDFINMAPHGHPGTGPPTPAMQMSDWTVPMSHEYQVPEYQNDAMSQQRQLPQLHRLHTLSIGRVDALGAPSPIDSLSGYTESDYASPMSHSFPPNDVPFLHSPAPMYHNFSSRNSITDQSPVVAMIPDARGPTSYPDRYYSQSEISSSLNSHSGLYDIVEGRAHQTSPPSHEVFYDDEMIGLSTL